MSAITKWDNRFLELAGLVSNWSKDPRGGVGAVLVTPTNRVLSVGFNGFPRGVNDSRVDLYGKRFVLHSEENAITFAQRDLTGCTLYTRPLPPCLGCTARIIQNGIGRVVSQFMPRELSAEQTAEHEESIRQLRDAKVAFLWYWA